MGFSDLGCYGGEISTPNLDALAKNGQFYNGTCCCPTRASPMTGLYPHRADVGGVEPPGGSIEADLAIDVPTEVAREKLSLLLAEIVHAWIIRARNAEF